MSAKPVRGVEVTRWLRRVLAAILAWNLSMGIYNLTMGRLFCLISFACVLGLAGAMTYQTKVIRRVERASRPRPDYSLIAAMEREIYGETFGHDGAPEPGGFVLPAGARITPPHGYGISLAEFGQNVAGLHRTMAGIPAVSMLCKGCGSPMSYARRYCLKCYRQYRKTTETPGDPR
jgi:hypothetical protein